MSFFFFFFYALINEREDDFPGRATKMCLRSHFSTIGEKTSRNFSVFFFFSFLLVFGIETSNRKKKNNYMNLREVNKSVAVFAARPLSSCLSHI